MDIAIQFERINMGEGRFLYKPIDIIKGEYDERTFKFISDCGVNYESIDGPDLLAENYFYCLTDIEELKRNNPGKTEKRILNEYLEYFNSMFYIGFYNNLSYSVDILELPYKELQSVIYNEEEKNGASVTELGESKQMLLAFDINKLKELRAASTLEELQQKLDEIINFFSTIENQNTSLDIVEPTKSLELKKEESSKLNLKKLQGEVLKSIISQDEVVKKVTTRVFSNYKSSDPRHKSHILIAGPTGTGKTEMIKLICKYLNIPFYKANSTDFTQEGYVGKSTSDMLVGLLSTCNNDLEAAQNGILVIDEIDKKSIGRESSESVATGAVQDSLLKITGRDIIQVDISSGCSKQTVDFDTSNLTVIMMGAFEGIGKQGKSQPLGFATEQKQKDIKRIDKQDLIKYGMTPELIGRIECFAQTRPFELEDYVKIIYKSKISPLSIEKNFFEQDLGISFTYTSNYIKEIAKKSKQLNLGARGVKQAIQESLEDVTERVLNGEKIKTLKLTKATALDNKKYCIE